MISNNGNYNLKKTPNNLKIKKPVNYENYMSYEDSSYLTELGDFLYTHQAHILELLLKLLSTFTYF